MGLLTRGLNLTESGLSVARFSTTEGTEGTEKILGKPAPLRKNSSRQGGFISVSSVVQKKFALVPLSRSRPGDRSSRVSVFCYSFFEPRNARMTRKKWVPSVQAIGEIETPTPDENRSVNSVSSWSKFCSPVCDSCCCA